MLQMPDGERGELARERRVFALGQVRHGETEEGAPGALLQQLVAVLGLFAARPPVSVPETRLPSGRRSLR